MISMKSPKAIIKLDQDFVDLEHTFDKVQEIKRLQREKSEISILNVNLQSIDSLPQNKNSNPKYLK
jgi:hypothetical protein